MWAITFALPAESSGFRRLLRRRVEAGPFCTGELHGCRLVVFHTGVGPKICRQRLPQLFMNKEIEGLISAGFAGGLDATLRAGDLLVADNFSTERMLGAARQILPGARFGALITTPKIVETADAREELREHSGAIAADMETGVIAAACAGIDFLSLRVISDTAAEPFPLPADVLFNLRKQKTRPGRLGRHLIRHPTALPRLLSFSRRIQRVRAELARALETILRSERFWKDRARAS
jgi:nucleoside phosphorylase